MAVPELTGPTLTPPESSSASFSSTIMASIDGFLMGSCALKCPTDPTTFIGLKVFSLLTSFQKVAPVAVT